MYVTYRELLNSGFFVACYFDAGDLFLVIG